MQRTKKRRAARTPKRIPLGSNLSSFERFQRIQSADSVFVQVKVYAAARRLTLPVAYGRLIEAGLAATKEEVTNGTAGQPTSISA